MIFLLNRLYNIFIVKTMWNISVPLFLMSILILLILEGHAASSVNPIWIPNSYFECHPAQIKTDITTSFGQADPITKTIPFQKTYTTIPQLGYAIKNYRGSDYLGTQNFAIQRTGLTTTGFTIYTLISGYTHLRIVTLQYLAVDRSFPYHLNVFNDIPANYSNGNLTSISTSNVGQRTYSNTINYTTLAGTIGSTHNKFGSNLSKNYVALYLCGIMNKGNVSSTHMVKFSVTTNILTIDQFSITIVVQDSYIIELIRFSIVSMDIDNVQKSGLFTIDFEYKVLDAQVDQYISIPRQFAPATFIGLLDYSTVNAYYGLQFNWEYDLTNNRIIINASHPYVDSSAVDGLLEYRVVVFYVKTWDCPSPNIYFNLVTNKCDDYCAKYMYANTTAQECQPCAVDCYQCTNGPLLGCTSCNPADNRQFVAGSCKCKSCYIQDPAGGTVCLTCSSQLTACSTCQLINGTTFGCLTCSTGYAWSGTACISCSISHCSSQVYNATTSGCSCSQCDTAGGYVTDGAGGCVLCTVFLTNCLQCSSQTVCTVCNTAVHYYLNSTTHHCQTCSLTGCTTCASLTTCQTCNTAADYFLDNTNVCVHCSLTQCTDCLSLTQCVTCNTAVDYFINASQLCQPCSLTGCLDCASLAQCTTCDTVSDYFMNAGTQLCQKCISIGCIDCLSKFQCVTCNNTADYFLDVNTNLCFPCPVLGCLDCATISTCSVCDNVNNYFIDGNLTCQLCTLNQCTTCISLTQCGVCNTAADYFLNSGTKLCEACALTNCLDCVSATQCLTCNVTVDYFLNTSKLCQSCTLNQCLDCSSLTTCVTCNQVNNYFLNTSTNLCQVCSQVGCLTCTSLTKCSLCDIGTFYDLNITTNQCYFCDSTLNLFINGNNKCEKCSLIGCIQCANLYLCNICDNAGGYFIDTDKLCHPCAVNQCTLCSTLYQCLICNVTNDYFLNIATNQCDACSLDHCLDCNSSIQCLTCNTSVNYFLNVSVVCELCSLNQCLVCSSLVACLVCSALNNYFINTTTNLCQFCVLQGCLTCSALTDCVLCDNSLLYDLNISTLQCFYCNATQNMFFNIMNTCENCSLSNCITCSSLVACTLCDQPAAYFLNTTTNLCQPCAMIGCITCQTLTTCSICDVANNYGLAPDGTCKQCPFTCLCDGYVLPKITNPITGVMECSTLCGDGLMRNSQQCDDGNSLNGDGCSSQCKIQTAWTCDNNPTYTCCTLESTQLQLKINKITKISGRNSMSLELQVTPTLAIMTPSNMKNFVSLTITGVPLFNEQKNIIGNQIMEVNYDYNQSIHGKKGNILFEIAFSQSGAPSCIISATKNITIMAQANNNLPFMFYQEKDLVKQEQVADSVNTAEIMTYVLFFLSMIPCKIIGLELIGVMQLAYFSLAQQENINILLEPFMKMNQINGLNFDMVAENQKLPDQVSVLGIKALFLNNCNVMLFLVLGEVLTAGVLYIIGHLMKSVSQKLSSISKYLIKEGLLTLMMFNCFNMAFGVGVHFQYADRNDPSYGMSSLAAVLASGLIFGACGLLMLTEAKQFGEFKDKLKPNLMCQLYFVFSLMYRFVLGYYIAVKTQYTLSSLIIVGFSFMFIGYNLINLPFTSAYHNYRANICHVSQLVILLVTNYYDSLTQSQPMEEKAYQFSAAEFQLAAIYTSVAFSAGCLGVQIYNFVKSKLPKSKSSSPLNSMKQSLPHSDINQTHQDLTLGLQQLQFQQFAHKK